MRKNKNVLGFSSKDTSLKSHTVRTILKCASQPLIRMCLWKGLDRPNHRDHEIRSEARVEDRFEPMARIIVCFLHVWPSHDHLYSSFEQNLGGNIPFPTLKSKTTCTYTFLVHNSSCCLCKLFFNQQTC